MLLPFFAVQSVLAGCGQNVRSFALISQPIQGESK